MASTIREEVGKVWSCRLFSWTEEGEARGIEASWSAEALVIGRYVELKGVISLERLPLPVLLDMETRIDKERRFINRVGRGEGAEEDQMETYSSQRLTNFLEVQFAVKEADIFRDDIVFSFGNVGSNTDNRSPALLFLGARDTERRNTFENLSLQQKYEQNIIAFRVMTDSNTGNVTGLELSTVWRISGGGESVGKPEYYFDVGLQYKYEGGGTVGDVLSGSKPPEPIIYQLLGRSEELDAGPIELECYLKFIYWNPIRKNYLPVPNGIEVRVIDYDPVSHNEVIGRGITTGGDGRVYIISVNKDEDDPDVLFELLTDGRYIELETSKFVTRQQWVPSKHYIALPRKWSSKDKYSVDCKLGYFDDFGKSSIGTASIPLTFRISLDCFIQFVYWNEVQQKYVGLPEGIEVEAIDYDPEAHLGIPIVEPLIGYIAQDDPLGRSSTGIDGKVYIRLFYKDEANPEIFFKYSVPDDKPNRIDLRSNRLSGESVPEQEIQLTASGPVVVERPIGAKMPRVENGTLPIPREWSTRQRYAFEDLEREGYWENFVGDHIGTPENPYVFDIFQEMPRFIAGNKVSHLIDGHRALPRIEEAIRDAKYSIHMEMMLFYNDKIGNRIKNLLIRKAGENVKVRLLFDAKVTSKGYFAFQSLKYWVDNNLVIMDRAFRRRLLEELDLKIEEERSRGNTTDIQRELQNTKNIDFLDSFRLLRSVPAELPAAYQHIEKQLPLLTFYTTDHRKMIIIDGKVGFLGGMNIGEEYLYDRPLEPAVDGEDWHDCFCEIRGPAVREMQKLFRERWVVLKEEERKKGREEGREEDEEEEDEFSIRPKLLVSVKSTGKYQTDLNNGNISEGLRQEFEKKRKISLSQDLIVLPHKADSEWWVDDMGNKQTYIVRKEKTELNIYGYGPHELGVGIDPEDPYFPKIDPEPENVSVKIVSTTPGVRNHVHEEYLTLIDNARKEIYIENPYLSCSEIKEHLIDAAKRGVSVHCIFPDEHSDSIAHLYSARRKYEEFLDAGVNVYEYKNHMTHAKVATIDDDIAVIGSANFTNVSMFGHYECNAFIKSREFTGEFKNSLFQRDIANSRKISRSDLDDLIKINPEAGLEAYLWILFINHFG